MLRTIVLSFLAGVMGTNAFPHFSRGITRERFQTVFGSSPTINLVAGWGGFVLTGVLVLVADIAAHRVAAMAAAACGALPMGLFHARGLTIPALPGRD
ncbi:hypothetical protein ACFPJ1_21405 [Kribbella qitaiheensis]|uniref:hypothetical protein n=1 Tax=Kribbella qitaiheensis TaxID=1544730 RepID=UPI0036220064